MRDREALSEACFAMQQIHQQEHIKGEIGKPGFPCFKPNCGNVLQDLQQEMIAVVLQKNLQLEMKKKKFIFPCYQNKSLFDLLHCLFLENNDAY